MQQSLSQKNSRAVAYWLLLGVLMLVVQIVLGGITRLTGSGLSITEWNVVTGTLPPLSGQQWWVEFNKYKQTPQFHLLHADFSLADFKFIFFWEWFHRLWARGVGVVFLVGFVWLVWKRKMTPSMIKPMLILFLLGALQGAIGWIMVVSGLEGDAVYVKPTRLALHFVFALGLLCYTFWFALSLLLRPGTAQKTTGLRRWTWVILSLLVLQFVYGALMAGHRAAAAAPTWPRINGDWIPANLFSKSPALLSLIDNPIAIQFIHRMVAYALGLATAFWTFKAYRTDLHSTGFKRSRWMPLALIGLQIILGISVVLSSPGIVANRWVLFDWLAQAHQLTGIIFLLVMLFALRSLMPPAPAT
jgi:heme a synthase